MTESAGVEPSTKVTVVVTRTEVHKVTVEDNDVNAAKAKVQRMIDDADDDDLCERFDKAVRIDWWDEG